MNEDMDGSWILMSLLLFFLPSFFFFLGVPSFLSFFPHPLSLSFSLSSFLASLVSGAPTPWLGDW